MKERTVVSIPNETFYKKLGIGEKKENILEEILLFLAILTFICLGLLFF